MNLRLVSGIAALLFPLLTIQTVLRIIPHPDVPLNPTSDQASAFFRDNYWVEQAQTWFHIMGILAFAVFLVGVCTLLREREAAPGFWSRLALFSGMGMVAVKVSAMIFVSSIISVHESLDGLLLLALYNAGWFAQSMMVYFSPVLFGALAVAILQTRVFASWTGWTAAIIAVLSIPAAMLIMSPTLGWATFPAFMMVMLWSLGCGVYFLVTSRQPAKGVVTAPAET